MNNDKLTKSEALKLITPVVDDEVNQQERNAFFAYIDKHEDVRKRYETEKKLKTLVGSRCSRAKASPSLRYRVRKFIRNQEFNQESDKSTPVYDIPAGSPSRQKVTPDKNQAVLSTFKRLF